MDTNSVLEVEDLSVKFMRYGKGLKQQELEVISGLNISIKKGEIVAVAGSSGSGKSLLAHAVMGILPSNASVMGSMKFCGENLSAKVQKRLRGNEITFVPQSISYLDPLMKVGKQVKGVQGTQTQCRKILKRFNLSQSVEKMFPFQLSGGMARRVLVSTAITATPKLLIADEPTPGLNVEMAKETMKTFRNMADKGCAVLLITHDIDLAYHYADRVAVFYSGTTVEIAHANDFFKGEEALRHPYSKALWRALPQNGFHAIEGFQPYGIEKGCSFAPRCGQTTSECRGSIEMRNVREGKVKCIYAT